MNEVVINDVPFIPQAVSVDATAVPDTGYVTFTVLQLGFTRIIKGGRFSQFNFPSIKNMQISVVPSDGVSLVKTFFYNYPAFIDEQGSSDVVLNGSVNIGNLPALTATNRLTVSKIVTGAVTNGAVALISTSTTQTIKLHSLSISKECTTSAPIVCEVYETGSTPASGSILAIPISATNNFGNTKLEPATPKLLGLGNDLLYTFSAADTIVGNLIITADYEIV
ncbi:hypothetical protein [Hydrotalea sp. AMD]|uniref:hypothetical protein n=1 Tax=Hydrotalea sp. AMD TaxID=2501297 RepID=UPI00257FFF1C|nr:hypothetical protein [Hydrotalea sp. AMD]